MIHLFLGTKAQYIKTAPVIWELEARGISYRLIDTGQHAARTIQLREEFKIRTPDVRLRSGENLSTIRTGLRWMSGWILEGMVRPRDIRRRIFGGEDGICLVHGDTASTWLGAWMAKRAGLKVAHLEAGLRSFHPFSPFPEELLRWNTTHRADLLLAPSAWAVENLSRMRLAGKVISLGANTGVETVLFSLRQPADAAVPWAEFALATIHRMETLYSKRRLNLVAKALLRAGEVCPILFLVHEPTQRALERAGLLQRLAASSRIQCRSLVSHRSFLHLLRQARFVLTDGGSVQEESFYLNVPCLLLRDRTERPEGLIPPGNVVLSRWRWEAIQGFLREPERFRHQEPLSNAQPSRAAVDALTQFT